MEGLLCLDCSADLADMPMCDQLHCVKCVCGLIYSVELIMSADRDRWEQARAERTFVRDAERLYITMTPIPAELHEAYLAMWQAYRPRRQVSNSCWSKT